MNHLKKLLFCCMLIALTATAAFAREARNALLIANGDYPDEIGDLPRPIPEAEELKAALKSIGFKVTLVKDADRETMEEALQQFKEKTEKAGGIAFFHYGGHAIQVNEINYLIPAHTNIKNESKVRSRGIKLDEIMESMSGEANIVVLDSCRDNPFKNSRGGGERGLAAVNKVPPKSIIIYSAGSGEKAKDGVFTPILIKKIIQPDKTIEKVFKEVSKEVQEKTANDQIQIPAAYTQLDEDIFLAGRTSSVKILTGSLLINSEFAGIVFIDGEQKSAIKEDGSILIEDLQTGSYTVEVKSDINTFKKKVKISDDNNRTVVSIKTGSIKLTSEVSGKVYLNDKYYQDIGSSGSILFTRLLEGNYHVEVRTESQTLKKDAEVRVGETTSVAVCKPEPEVSAIQNQMKTQTEPKKEPIGENGFYAPGFSIGYSFSHITVSDIASFNAHGVDLKLEPARFALGAFDLKILYFGYSYSHAVITSKNNEKREELDYHEFNFVPIKLGSNLSLFSFHIGAGLAILWENAPYLKLQLKNPADIFKIGVVIPMDIGIQFADFIGIYAEYKPAIMPITSYKPFVKHSLNVGFSFYIPCYL